MSESVESHPVTGFGKIAWEAAKASAQASGAFPDRKLFSDHWSQVHPDLQCAWVAGAQAVLKEARKCGWF